MDTKWKNLNKEFVTRDGSDLLLKNKPFRMSGTNIYWMGLDENVGGVDYPTYFRIKNALDTAAEMGVNVVRSHMMTSTGQNDQNPLAIMPSLGQYNEEAFKTVDFAIAYAGSLGIRLILPLTDEWSYYHGGHRDFTTPLGLQPADFYTNPDAIAAYQDYVTMILERTNSLTGVKYTEDPTIMAWELGNELEGMTLEWINQQVDLINEEAPNQLVAAGRRFDIDPDTLTAPELDIVDVHYYPPTAEKVAVHAEAVTNADKVYIAGEYGSTSASPELLEAAAANPDVAGMFFWSLFGHNDTGGYVPHDDGFTLHYPGQTQKEVSQVQSIQNYGAAIGTKPGTVKLDTPLITSIENKSGINSISWRGVAGAGNYIVERSTDGTTWVPLTEQPVTAAASPLTDAESPDNSSYRVIAVKPDGTLGKPSEVVSTHDGNNSVLVDPLESWLMTAGHEGAAIQARPGESIVSGDGDGTSHLMWERDNITRVEIALSDAKGVEIQATTDGQTWTKVNATIEKRKGQAVLVATGLGASAVKVVWPATSVTEIYGASIWNESPRPALYDPLNDWSLTQSHHGSLAFDHGNVANFAGDTSRVKRESADPASIVWALNDISGADITAWYWPDQPASNLEVSGSSDGQSWAPLPVQVDSNEGNWKEFTYRLRGITGVNYLKVTWPAATGQVWSPQLGEVALYSAQGSDLAVPGAFQISSPSHETTGVVDTPTFSWTPASDAAYYNFSLSLSPDMSNPLVEARTLPATAYKPQVDLDPATTYYWSVTAVNGEGQTTAGPGTASFTTAALPTEPLTIDDFDQYASDVDVAATYVPNSGGDPINATLVPNPQTGSKALSLNYTAGTAGYAGLIHKLPAPQNWWGYNGLEMWVLPNATNTFTLQFVADGSYWETTVRTTGTEWQKVTIPFTAFAPPSWAPEAEFDVTKVTEVSVYVNGAGNGALVIDDLRTTLTAAP
jgi:Cellulase (glycosyl hydrolase family 5)/Carbohydrate binding domain (family 11)